MAGLNEHVCVPTEKRSLAQLCRNAANEREESASARMSVRMSKKSILSQANHLLTPSYLKSGRLVKYLAVNKHISRDFFILFSFINIFFIFPFE